MDLKNRTIIILSILILAVCFISVNFDNLKITGATVDPLVVTWTRTFSSGDRECAKIGRPCSKANDAGGLVVSCSKTRVYSGKALCLSTIIGSGVDWGEVSSGGNAQCAKVGRLCIKTYEAEGAVASLAGSSCEVPRVYKGVALCSSEVVGEGVYWKDSLYLTGNSRCLGKGVCIITYYIDGTVASLAGYSSSCEVPRVYNGIALCGEDELETGENCLADTQCLSGICLNGACYEIACNTNADCNDGIASTKDTCKYPGQLNAVCLNEPRICEDSDGGQESFTFGIVTHGVMVNGKYQISYDYCLKEGGPLIENYCENFEMKSISIDCDCVDGVCKKPSGNDATTGVGCIDSDGRNYLTAGEVQHGGLIDGRMMIHYDICRNGVLTEKYCDNGYYASENVQCTGGCSSDKKSCVGYAPECTINNDCLDPNEPYCINNVCVECISNSNCDSGYECDNNICVMVVPECSTNNDCSDPEPYCVDDICVECEVNDDCEDSSDPYCNNNNVCVSCIDNADCASGYECRSGGCSLIYTGSGTPSGGGGTYTTETFCYNVRKGKVCEGYPPDSEFNELCRQDLCGICPADSKYCCAWDPNLGCYGAGMGIEYYKQFFNCPEYGKCGAELKNLQVRGICTCIAEDPKRCEGAPPLFTTVRKIACTMEIQEEPEEEPEAQLSFLERVGWLKITLAVIAGLGVILALIYYIIKKRAERIVIPRVFSAKIPGKKP